MIRFLNLLALCAVIGSATWAYSVKYETILVAEKLKKREVELRKERDAIQVLAAEWELLNRPARLSVLAKPEAGMQQLSARQVVNPRDIPAAQPAKTDSLDHLLTGSIPPAPPAPKVAPVVAGKPGAAKPVAGKAKDTKKAAKAPGDKPDAKVVAVQGAPMSLAPKISPVPKGAAAKAAPGKAASAKAAPPKTAAPKAGGPVRLSPPAAVGQASAPAPQRSESGLNSLFKKILN